MLPETSEWFAQAEYDFETAVAMYDSQRYVYTVFMCHLSLEKALKGLIAEHTRTVPPKNHNLVRLAKLAEVKLNKQQLEFIAILSNAAISTRYPEMLQKAIARYPAHVAFEYLTKTKDVLQCLKRELK